MRAKLANLNHCAVPFLSRAAVNLYRNYYILFHAILKGFYTCSWRLDLNDTYLNLDFCLTKDTT